MAALNKGSALGRFIIVLINPPDTNGNNPNPRKIKSVCVSFLPKKSSPVESPYTNSAKSTMTPSIRVNPIRILTKS